MKQKEKVAAIIAALKAQYPEPVCALQYKKDYELMISVRLAAQCTDARVNQITPALFARYPTLEAMAGAEIAEVEQLVHTCGFYRQKAADIVHACQMLLRDYGGKVPGTMPELLRLPGVGRKRRIFCWAIYTRCLAVSCAIPTASAFPTAWAWPRARSRRR